MVIKTHASHTGVPGSSPGSGSSFLPVQISEAVVMAQVTEVLLLTQETRVAFPAPDFGFSPDTGVAGIWEYNNKSEHSFSQIKTKVKIKKVYNKAMIYKIPS